MPKPLLWVLVQVMSGMLVAPRVPEAAERLEMATLVDTCCSLPLNLPTSAADMSMRSQLL